MLPTFIIGGNAKFQRKGMKTKMWFFPHPVSTDPLSSVYGPQLRLHNLCVWKMANAFRKSCSWFWVNFFTSISVSQSYSVPNLRNNDEAMPSPIARASLWTCEISYLQSLGGLSIRRQAKTPGPGTNSVSFIRAKESSSSSVRQSSTTY